jgi:hypothetical protein
MKDKIKNTWDIFENDLKEFLQNTQLTKERDNILKQINIAISVGEYDEARRILEQAIKKVEV